jgi:hypothetical protein
MVMVCVVSVVALVTGDEAGETVVAEALATEINLLTV